MAELGAAASALRISSLVIQVMEHLQTQVILRGCELSASCWDPILNNKFTSLMGLIRDLIQVGSKLHGPSMDSKFHNTPFMDLFRGFMAGSRAQDWFRVELEVHGTTPFTHIELVVRVWLHQLKLSGIDLMAYGREGQSVHRVADVLREWWFYEWNVDENDTNRASRRGLTSFSYGPEPKD